MDQLAFDATVSAGDLVSALSLAALFIGALVSLRRFRRTIDLSNRTHAFGHYAELDRFYFDLLAMTMDRPLLRSPKPLLTDGDALKGKYQPFARSDRRRAAYDTYALMVWCFLETIHDRCVETPEPKQRAQLMATWVTAIRAEDRIHRGWFLSQLAGAAEDRSSGVASQSQFCPEFALFVLERHWERDDWAYSKDAALRLEHLLRLAHQAPSGGADRAIRSPKVTLSSQPLSQVR